MSTRKLIFNSETQEYLAVSDTMWNIVEYLLKCKGKSSSFDNLSQSLDIPTPTLRMMALRLENFDVAVRYCTPNGRYKQGHLRLNKNIVVIGDVKFVTVRKES